MRPSRTFQILNLRALTQSKIYALLSGTLLTLLEISDNHSIRFIIQSLQLFTFLYTCIKISNLIFSRRYALPYTTQGMMCALNALLEPFIVGVSMSRDKIEKENAHICDMRRPVNNNKFSGNLSSPLDQMHFRQ